MAGFMTYWSKEHIRDLEKAGDEGPLTVIFGSHHTAMPTINSVRPGDILFPVTLSRGSLCVMGRLPVEEMETAFFYLLRETGHPHDALVPDGYAFRHKYNYKDEYFYLMSDGEMIDTPEKLPPGTKLIILEELPPVPHKLHQEPHTCCAQKAAWGRHGSSIRPRPLPPEVLPELRFGPAPEKEKPLRLGKNGLPAIMSLSGNVRRMSEGTLAIFEKLFEEGKEG